MDGDGATEVLVPVDTEVVALHNELVGTERAVIPFLTIGSFVLRVLGELEDFFVQVISGFHSGGESAELDTAGDQLPVCAHLIHVVDNRVVRFDILAGHASAGVGGDGESESDESHG